MGEGKGGRAAANNGGEVFDRRGMLSRHRNGGRDVQARPARHAGVWTHLQDAAIAVGAVWVEEALEVIEDSSLIIIPVREGRREGGKRFVRVNERAVLHPHAVDRQRWWCIVLWYDCGVVFTRG